MKGGLFRDVLLVTAPCAALVAGLSSIDHHQRLVEAGYRVGTLERERDSLAREVEHRRAVVSGLASPVRLLAAARERAIPVDYPLGWNVLEGDGEAARFLAGRAPAPVLRPAPPRRGGPGAVRLASRGKTAKGTRP